MDGSRRQAHPISWELTVELGKDALGKHRRKYVTVRGNKTEAYRKLRELLTTVGLGTGPHRHSATILARDGDDDIPL